MKSFTKSLLGLFILLFVAQIGRSQTLKDFKDIYGKDEDYAISQLGSPFNRVVGNNLGTSQLDYGSYYISFPENKAATITIYRPFNYGGEFPFGITKYIKEANLYTIFKYVEKHEEGNTNSYACSFTSEHPKLGDENSIEFDFYVDKEGVSGLYTIIFGLSLIKNIAEIDKKIEEPISNQKPPILSISNVVFSDPGGNNIIDGNEACKICFTVSNTGKGAARELNAKLENLSSVKGIKFEDYIIGSIEPNGSKKVCIPISGSMQLTTGTAKLKISFTEKMGMAPDPIDLSIATREFNKPKVIVADNAFYSDNGNLKLGLPIQLKTLIQNIGQGEVQNVTVNFTYPAKNVFANSESSFNLGTLASGAQKEVTFEFIANKLYTASTIPISVSIIEKTGLLSYSKTMTAEVDSKSSETSILVEGKVGETSKTNIEIGSLSADVDKNIPVNDIHKENSYALIIGNENYSDFQSGISTESNVDFARNDARVFNDYCKKTLGIPIDNISLITDGTAGKMKQAIDKLKTLIKNSDGKLQVLFYYAGHGLPDETTHEPYLVPVDVSGKDLSGAIKMAEVYNSLTAYPSKGVTVFLDACFSGGARNQPLVAARAVRIKPKEETLNGRITVFTASSGDQTSWPFKDKQHGIFTYFLLKKLQESKGDISYADLGNYLNQQVKFQSVKINSKEQEPQLIYGSDITSDELATTKLKDGFK